MMRRDETIRERILFIHTYIHLIVIHLIIATRELVMIIQKIAIVHVHQNDTYNPQYK